jgi:hypothetical protein
MKKQIEDFREDPTIHDGQRQPFEKLNNEMLGAVRGGLAIFPFLAGKKLGESIRDALRDWFGEPPA